MLLILAEGPEGGTQLWARCRMESHSARSGPRTTLLFWSWPCPTLPQAHRHGAASALSLPTAQLFLPTMPASAKCWPNWTVVF